MAIHICTTRAQANDISGTKQIWHDVPNARWIVRTGEDIETTPVETLLDDIELRKSMVRQTINGKIFKAGNTTTGWTGTSGTTLSAVTTPSGGPQDYRTSADTCLRLQTTAGTSSMTVGSIVMGPVGNPRVDVWVYVDDYANLTNVALYFATDGSFTNYYLKNVTPNAHNGWQLITIDLSTITPTGSPTYETITFFRIGLAAATSAGTSIIFDRAIIGSGGLTRCALIWDDGSASDYDYVLPLLNKYGLLGNFAIYETSVRLEQWRTMAHLGHRLIVHGTNNLSTLSDMSAVEDDILANKEWIDNLGGIGSDSDVYVYPNGVYLFSAGNLAIPALLKQMGFKGAFATKNSRIAQARGIDRYTLTRVEANATTVAATFLTTVDQIIAGGWSFATCMHNVVASGATGDAMNRQVVDDILAGIRSRVDSGKLDVCSARDLVSYVSPD